MMLVVSTSMAEFGVAQLVRYLESHDPHALDQAIELLHGGVRHLLDSDSSKIGYMLRLADALALRFGLAHNAFDFHEALSWNKRVLQANPDDATRLNAFFNIGALQSEEYKRSGELSVLGAAIDNFVESLQLSDYEHPLRKALVKSLQQTLIELTAKTPEPKDTMARWQRAFRAVPFRSFDQRALTQAWHLAFGQHVKTAEPSPAPSFLANNRARLSKHAAANEAPALRAIADRSHVVHVENYEVLRKGVEELRAKFPGALLAFRGQTEFHDGLLVPSMARKTAQDGEETHLLWITAVGENLRYGEPDQVAQMVREIKALAGVALPPELDEKFWAEADPAGPAAQAILQHYGARTEFIDVSTSLEVALWFAHFRFQSRRDVFRLEDLAALGARWEEDDAVPEYDTAWYEPAWSGTTPTLGYLFVLAPRLPQSGETLVHGEYIDLSCCPSPRMQAQHAALVYMDLHREERGALVVFKFRLPLRGAPAEVLDPSVTRLFPGPDDDPLYGRILWSTPFWPNADRPSVQVRRLRIPEYHPAPAARPEGKEWGDWSEFRSRDMYTRPGFLFPRLARETCVVAGRKFQLSDAAPLVPGVPSMMIEFSVPEPGARLDVLGRSEVFLEYDPLSRSLSARTAAHHITAQIDQRHSLRGSWVPLPGVRGAWVVQVEDLYWCRVYTQADDLRIAGTAGRAFGFDPQFGWIVKEGGDTVTGSEVIVSEALGMRAERAAFYLVLGLAGQVAAGTWSVTETAGSPFFQLRIVR